MTKDLLILAAGMSSRMKESLPTEGLSEEEVAMANTKSKALITIGELKRPFLDILLRNAEAAGYRNIFLITGKDRNGFEHYYGTQKMGNSFGKLTISYATQHIPPNKSKPMGTSDAVVQALEEYPSLQNKKVTVCNSDNLYSVPVLKAMSQSKAANSFIAYDRAGLQFDMDRIRNFALVVLNEENHLINIIEKPTADTIDIYKDKDGKLRVSMNIFTIHAPTVYPYLKSCPEHPIRKEKELPTAILSYCKAIPNNFKGILACEHVPDLTRKEDIIAVNRYLEDRK